MGLMQDADEALRHAKEEADKKKAVDEAATRAKEEAKKEQEQHEQNKRQGMI